MATEVTAAKRASTVPLRTDRGKPLHDFGFPCRTPWVGVVVDEGGTKIENQHGECDGIRVVSQRSNQVDQCTDESAETSRAFVGDGRADRVRNNEKCGEHRGAAEEVEQGTAATF